MSSFCKSYSHFFSKNTCELDIILTRPVNILTTNGPVKLTMLWTTGPSPNTFIARTAIIRNRYNYQPPSVQVTEGKEERTWCNGNTIKTLQAESQNETFFPKNMFAFQLALILFLRNCQTCLKYHRRGLGGRNTRIWCRDDKIQSKPGISFM